ncbi:MAG: outer membrane protein assembly factor BamD [Candidatus Omnitrophota bacterium]|jgi:outer membrane protein assembly factor BamD (BamD/ComL family)
MKNLVFLVSLMACFWNAAPGYSFWIWTPKTGKFVNPKTEAKPTPKEQFEYAKSFFDEKKYDDAARELKKVLKTYPKSLEASEAQYYLGLTEEAQGKPYEAYQAFQKVIEKYPFSERIAEINERIYKIGESFMSGVKRKSMGVVLPVENPAIEIFQKVVDNSTYGPLAPKAQYKLGLVLKGTSRYYEAEDAFNKVLSNYPESEWVEAARFQIASCKASVSRSPDYDQGGVKDAKDKFEEFVREHPDAVLSRDAEKSIQQLNEREAESNYSIARFYEKQKTFESARIYYKNIITNYPDSPWAAKATERLNILDTGEKQK